MIRKYCKAYYLKDLRQFGALTEKREESETDEDIVYLWDDFVVVRSPVLPGGVIFDTVTPEWQDFCHTTFGGIANPQSARKRDLVYDLARRVSGATGSLQWRD